MLLKSNGGCGVIDGQYSELFKLISILDVMVRGQVTFGIKKMFVPLFGYIKTYLIDERSYVICNILYQCCKGIYVLKVAIEKFLYRNVKEVEVIVFEGCVLVGEHLLQNKPENDPMISDISCMCNDGVSYSYSYVCSGFYRCIFHLHVGYWLNDTAKRPTWVLSTLRM